MKAKKYILLKITGEALSKSADNGIDSFVIRSIAQQILSLRETHYFGIVIGGGNFFRGSKQGAQLGLSPSVGHQIGMLATMMNGLILRDVFEQEGLPTTLFTAIPSSEIGVPISDQGIKNALDNDICMVFAGGTGNPFFTTDTTAVLRGLQINADCVWKGTNVDGIYTNDPRLFPEAQLIKKTSYQEVLDKNLKILDATAFVLAKEHHLKIRVFNIFKENALINASRDDQVGSLVE